MAGANGMRTAEGTVALRQCNITSNNQIYLFVLALFGQEHTTFVLALFIYLYSLYLRLVVTEPLYLGYREFPRIQRWQEQLACGRLKGLLHSGNLTKPLTKTCIYLYWLYLGKSTHPLYLLYFFTCIRPIGF